MLTKTGTSLFKEASSASATVPNAKLSDKISNGFTKSLRVTMPMFLLGGAAYGTASGEQSLGEAAGGIAGGFAGDALADKGFNKVWKPTSRFLGLNKKLAGGIGWLARIPVSMGAWVYGEHFGGKLANKFLPIYKRKLPEINYRSSDNA